MPITEKIIIPAAKDPSLIHIYASLVKSAVRIAAGGAFLVAGWYLEEWGVWVMVAGALLIIAEVLGIVEEL